MILLKKKYNIVSKDWKLISRLKLDSTPQPGHNIYIDSEKRYYSVVMVIHKESTLSPTTTIIVEPTTINTDESHQ
jgi:hypothetical protein